MANCDYQTITDIYVGEGCSAFTSGVFYNFVNLRNLYLTSTLQTTTGGDTRYCWNFANIYLPSESQYLELDQYGALYTKGKERLIRLPPRKPSYTFPSQTKIIGEQAFQGCGVLPSLTIPKTIETLNSGFLYDSGGIKSVYFESGSPITTITYFSYASGMTYILLAKTVTTIAASAFDHAIHLKTVDFESGSNLQTVNAGAFAYTVIERFTFPPKCTTILNSIFNPCTTLNYIYIPASLVNINTQAFAGAPNIQTIQIDSNNAKFTVQDSATLMLKDKTKYLYIPPSIKSFTIGKEVVEFGLTIFQSCSQLTSITVDANNNNFVALNGIIYTKGYLKAIACIGGMTSATTRSECQQIGDYCFYNCKLLTSITLNEGIKSLGQESFEYVNVNTLNIPSSVESIGYLCFWYATINTVKTNGNGPKTISSKAFMNCHINSVNFGLNLNSMGDQAFSTSQIVSVTFNDNCPMNRIYFQSFINCPSFKSVRIPKNVLHIEDRAFDHCTSLTDVTFATGSQLNYLETMCFRATKVKSISFPTTLNYLGANAFSECPLLSSVTFAPGTNLPTLASGVFRSCTSLPTVTIPSTVTNFDPSTFVFCSNLLYINVPTDNVNYCSNDGVVYTKNQEKLVCCPGGKVSALIFKYIIIIGSNAFYGCSKLQTLTFEKGCQLREIQDGTFYSCTVLLRVDLPTSLQTVQHNAFAGCTLLSVITFTDYALADLGADSIFADCVSLTTITFGRFCALQHLQELC